MTEDFTTSDSDSKNQNQFPFANESLIEKIECVDA